MYKGETGQFNIISTSPETQANFRQNWELISFVFIKEGLQEQGILAVSTAAVFPPFPFETFIFPSAERVRSQLKKVNGMEVFTFDHGTIDHPEGHYGKVQQMEEGCIDHFSLIVKAVFKLQSPPPNLVKTPGRKYPKSFGIVTFIYKPMQNGWIAVETIKEEGKIRTMIHPRANKADVKEAWQNRETLYFDSNLGQEVNSTSPGLETHFGVICDEVEANLGYFCGLKPCAFDREKLKVLIGSKI